MAEIEPRNTTKTPPQTKKVHREFKISLPFRHLAARCGLLPTQNGTAEAEKNPASRTSESPLCEHGQQAGVRQLLATTWQDMRLLLSCPPENPLGSLLEVEST